MLPEVVPALRWEMTCGGEAGHVGAGFGDDDVGGQGADARDGADQVAKPVKGLGRRLDAGGDVSDRSGLLVDQVQMNSGQERVAVLVTLQLAWLIETLIGERVDRKTLFSSLCFHMTQAGTRGLEPGDWVEVVAPGDDLDGKPGRIEAIVDHGDGFDVIVMGSPNTWRFRRDKLRKIPPPLPPSEQQLELSYDAGEKTMSAQDTHLGDVRSRASILLSTSALFISFSAGIGLIKTDPTKGAVLSPTKGIVLLFVVLVLGLCACMCYGP